MAWKVAVPPGHSSPVVCGNHLYLTSFDSASLRTHAFDTVTGKSLWVRELPRERAAKHHSLNNAASPTPACDDSGVVVYFSDFGIASWKADGKPMWKVPMAPVANVHGRASSPVLSGEFVIQVSGSDMGSEVLAYRRSSGKHVWSERLLGVTYSTPVIAPDAQVIVISTSELISMDLQTGSRRWWVFGVPYQPKSSPIMSADGRILYFSALSVEEGSKAQLSSYEKLLGMFDGNGDGQITLEEVRERKGPVGAFPQIDLNGDGVFTRQEQQAIMKIAESPHITAAVSTQGKGDQTQKLLWTVRKGVPNVSSPILVGDILYLFKEGGILTSIRAADGSVIKEGRVAVGFGAIYSSAVALGNSLLVANQQGKFVLLKAEPEWEVVASNDLGEECFATPAVSGGSVFVRTVSNLYCFHQSR